MASSENKKTGARFNLFDLILILVVIACITGIVLHAYFTKDLNDAYTETAKISIRVDGVSEQTAKAFCRIGASIYLQDTDENIGTLIEAQYQALSLDLESADGMVVKATHPEKKQITATATVSGAWTEDGFLIAGKTLAIVGQSLKIYTDDAVCTITITNVTE